VPQRDQVPGAFAGSRNVVEHNVVKIGIFSNAIQKNRGYAALPHILERGRVVAAWHDEQSINFTLNQRADPLPLPSEVFLAVGENELVVGKGGTLCKASHDRGEKATGDVGYHDTDGTQAARGHRIRAVVQGSNRFLNTLLKFRPDVARAPQDVGHRGCGYAGRPGHVVDGRVAMFSLTSAPGTHGQKMAQWRERRNKFVKEIYLKFDFILN